MGQFKPYVESYHPARLDRGIQLVVPLVFVVRAILHTSLENILWAILILATMLPSAIAPEAIKNRGTRWEREHPIQAGVFITLTAVCGLFLILRWFLSRPHSLLIAVPLALAYAALLIFTKRHKRRR